MVRALVGDSTMTSVRPPPLSDRAGVLRFTLLAAFTTTAALAALVALAFVVFFAGAFFFPDGVRVPISPRPWGRKGGEYWCASGYQPACRRASATTSSAVSSAVR